MNYKEIIKKQSFIIALSVIVMAIILIGSSYALFSQVDKSTNAQVVETGTLSVTYTPSAESTTQTADIEPADESSAKTYTFTVDNTGSLAMDYNVLIYTDTGNTVPHSVITVKIDDGAATVLSSLTKSTDSENINSIRYLLGQYTLAESTAETHSKTHTVKVWINDTAAEELANSQMIVKVSVNGIVSGSES